MKLIALSDGHGMETAGKRTPFIPEINRYIRENEFNRAVVNYLDIELRRCGFNTLLLASTDFDTSLDDRTDKANNAKADAYVSIHYNALDGTFDDVDPEGHSIHIYPKSVEGRKLAESVLKYLVQGTEQKNRGIIESDFHELRESHMPAILSENGFMDNRKESLYMIDENFQREVANEHARGICDYFNVDYIPEGMSNDFITRSELELILKNYVKKEVETIYEPKTIKKFDSLIYYLETGDMFVDVDLGVRFKKETVSEIVKSKGAVAGINGGFFGASKESEHIGLLIDEELYYNPPNSDFVEFIYYKSGLTEIVNMTEYDKAVLSELQANTHWAIGTSYSLIQRGKINLLNADKFSHSTSKQPRTMIGQKFDGSFVLAVADGRTTVSAGLTAQEQAEVMLELGCYNAVNLDGGGSSTMVFDNKVINNPSDGAERQVGSVILVKAL